MLSTELFINIDHLEEDDLVKYIQKCQETRGVTSDKNDLRILGDLRAYAQNKLHALRDRKKGDIREAKAHEYACDILYSKLPLYARW